MTVFEQLLIEYHSTLRMLVFVLLIALLLLLERVLPRRHFENDIGWRRRSANLVLLFVNILALRIFVPLAAFEFALIIAGKEWGLFNLFGLPLWLNLVLSILVFDLLIYLQHVAFHYFKPLWRIHRVHHTDLQFDVTTGVRFHPVEIVLSMLYKFLAIVLLGPAAVSIILYEILLNAASLFTHSNIRMNSHTDAVLRKLIVTPDMHRVHHSVIRKETDSNYGNIFSFWDKLFGTYIAQPEDGHDGMQIGLQGFRDASQHRLVQLLGIPFRNIPGI